MKKIISLFCAVIMALTCFAACQKPGYKDTAERPEIEGLPSMRHLVYPSLPASAPAVNTDNVTSVDEYIAGEGYTVTQKAEGVEISYEDIADWQYVYVTVKDYQKKYSNFKITAEGNGAERIAIAAIYYEMKDGYRPVAVFNGDLMNGEQYVIAELGDFKPLNSAYNPVMSESLEDKTILGFVILLDSNPSQVPAADRAGSFLITNFEFLEDGDPKLLDKYVSPKVANISADGDYDVDSSGEFTEVSYGAGKQQYAKVSINIINFASEYTEFTLQLSTTGVKSYSVAVAFNTKGNTGWFDEIMVLDVLAATDGDHTHTIDFAAANPVNSTSYLPVPEFYVKNFEVTAVRIYLDPVPSVSWDAGAVIKGINFIRAENSATVISKNWVSQVPNIAVTGETQTGGVGVVDISHYTTWHYLSMPVSGYLPHEKLVVTIKTPDGLDSIGIALFAEGTEYILRSSYEKLDGNNSDNDPKASALTGLGAEIAYDEANKIYTFTFDFSNVRKNVVTGKAPNENAVSLLRFYFNDADGTNAFEGTRTVQFISIAFENQIVYEE